MNATERRALKRSRPDATYRADIRAIIVETGVMITTKRGLVRAEKKKRYIRQLYLSNCHSCFGSDFRIFLRIRTIRKKTDTTPAEYQKTFHLSRRIERKDALRVPIEWDDEGKVTRTEKREATPSRPFVGDERYQYVESERFDCVEALVKHLGYLGYPESGARSMLDALQFGGE